MSEKPYQNRLAGEKSPYLLQHSTSPINWYPWGDEAFQAALVNDKPIFLSIGYATCHWCHVMEKESFRSRELADLMNDTFISIKLDREEFPEVDNLYMEFAQAFISSGSGWPLNVILTPDLKPFFACTYLPPDITGDMMGLKQLILNIQEMWNSEQRAAIFEEAEKLFMAFKQSQVVEGNEMPTKEHVQKGLSAYFQVADPLYGGIKDQLKFPLSYHIEYLLERAKHKEDQRALFFAELTLEKILGGGIYDQIGGGISRYAVDERWQIPHFEKMLYDNALFLRALVTTWKFTRKETFLRIAEETKEYILRELAHKEGGYYSAEDADTEGVEGKYYLWDFKELEHLIDPEIFPLFCLYYHMTPSGNFHNKNLLFTTQPLELFAKEQKKDPHQLTQQFKQIKQKLFQEREKRTKPFKDDKILTSWNALLLDAFVELYAVTKDVTLKTNIDLSCRFIKNHLFQQNQLLRRYREGHADFEGTLDDYVFLIRAYLNLFEKGFGTHFLQDAIVLTQNVKKHFKADNGAFYLSCESDDVIVRKCEFYDGPIPSGNAIHTENLIRLFDLTRVPEYLEDAQDVFKAVKAHIEIYPPSSLYHLMNLSFYLNDKRKTLVVALDQNNTYYDELSHLIFQKYHPHTSVIWKNESDSLLHQLMPYLTECRPIDGQTTLYAYDTQSYLPPMIQFPEMKRFIEQL